MDLDLLQTVSAGLILLASLSLLLSRDWRWSIVALAGQYVGAGVLVLGSWPVEMAGVKLVAGWMAGAVLGTTRIGLPVEREEAPLIGRLIRLLAAGLVLLVVFSSAPGAVVWLPEISLVQVWGASMLIGIGMLHLGFSGRPFRVILALLTVLTGFEILYASVESSTLVAGLLAGIHLSLALVGAYLMVAPLRGQSS